MEQELIPYFIPHPGIVLKKELVARHITQRRFAGMINMQPTMLNEIIKGKRSVSAEIAILLEKALEIDADFWLRFQSQYDLDIARQKLKTIQRLEQIEEKIQLAGK
jgi:HTH-type transcriptional regulator/antitoxin HigA